MLGDNIKSIMAEKGLKSKKLAEIIGISATHLSYILNGKRIPSVDVLEKIAKALDVSVGDLYGDDRPQEQPLLNARDRKDIDKDLAQMMEEFREGTGDEHYYNGIKLKEEDLDLIEAAMKIALEQIKIKNKELYTPKKYKKNKK